ncbi:MAG: hypothetical protein C4519_11365 [Desulfobacteraceae bacterium]|nr:MAG: hypothetical protein C4519_11365 [Desulfobacteraceae bacterium]
MSRNRRGFTKEFKVDAVKLITEQGYKITEAARNLGICGALLYLPNPRVHARQAAQGRNDFRQTNS